jgi:hypothetical protein
MKIVKRVGEQLLPSWLRAELRSVLAFTGTGSALWHGSFELAGRGWAALCERCDWPERIGIILGGGYLAVYECVHAPHLAQFVAPSALTAWCIAAWCVCPPVLDDPAPSEEARPARDGFIWWLVDLIGEQPGIHLRDLYPAMRALPGHEARDNLQLRAALRTLGIPVRRSLRLSGVAGRSGVALADLQPLPSPPGESGGEFDGDAGQDADSPAGELHATQLESG